MNLPKIVFNIITGCACIVTVVAGLVSCREDDLTDGIDFTIPGEDVTLTVPISLPKMDVQTRADISQNNLDKVETLWIATFSAGTGEMTSKTKDDTNIGWHKIKNPSGYNEPNTQEVVLNTKSGPSYIVAVANVETNKGVKKSDFNGNQAGDTQQQPTEQSLADLLSAVTTWEGFLDIAVVTPSTHSLINAPTTPLPMAGAYTNLAPSSPHSTTKEWETENFQPYTIPYTKSGEYEFKNGAIHLRRLVSQVKFNLVPGSNVNIIPHSYQVVNVPKYSWLYERAQSEIYTANFGDNCSRDPRDTRSDYYSTPETFIANNFQLINPANVAEGYTFNYWQSENKHTGNTVNTGLSKEEWSDEKKLYNGRDLISNNSPDFRKDAPYESPEFQQNALFTSLTGSEWSSNNMATYVLISCTVEYTGENNNGKIEVNEKGETGKEDSKTPVTRVGEATYLIHLGYVGADVNDFNCYRNTKYTYNVTINGVDDIRVEAYGEGDTPGVEGMVDDSEKPIRWLDCHYHAYNIQLSADDLKAWDKQVNGTGFRFIITTYDTGVEKTFTEEDFKDVNFQDCDFNTIKKYVDWIELRPTTENKLAEYKPRGHVDGLTFNLIDASKGISDKQKSSSGWYTLFVKEYTYDASESDPANETIGSRTEPLWKSYVFQNPRSFYIRVTKKVSDDGQSMYTRSKYSGRQRSIMTYYDRDIITKSDETGKTNGSAIGIEHINESLGLNLRQSFTSSNDPNNGRLNCCNFVGYTHNGSNWIQGGDDAKKWIYYLDLTEPQKVPQIGTNGIDPATNQVYLPKIKNYKGTLVIWDQQRNPYRGNNPDYYIEAIAACMNRNRDNNGDGVIQENEMRWYVPTMGKYLRIYLGQEALSPDQLINYNTMYDWSQTVTADKIANITKNGQWGRYLFFGSDSNVWWAMEGLSTSEYGRFNDNLRDLAKPWEVRCIRNLGTNLNHVFNNNQTIPAYTFKPNEGGVKNGGKVYPTYYQTTQMRSTRYFGNGTGAGQMPVHTIAENYNTIYQGGFEISNPESDIAGAKYDGIIRAEGWKVLIDYINNNPNENDHRNPCTVKGDGWRIPNVRELAIMKNLGIIDMNGDGHYFICCSMGIIDGNGKKFLTIDNAFLTAGEQFFMSAVRLSGTEFNIQKDFHNPYYVRCVKDL